MNIEVKNKNEIYEIPLYSITQLCGENIEKKEFICYSLEKFFSLSKYMSWEEKYKDNIRIDGNEVNRQYFKSVAISSRDDLIKILKLSKTSMMMKYVEQCYMKFDYQVMLEQISDMLDQIFINMNNEIKSVIGNFELDYQKNNMINIVSSSEMCGCNEKPLESLSNKELFMGVIRLLAEIQKTNPQKILLIVRNIDHLLYFEEYCDLLKNIEYISRYSEIYSVFTMSIGNYVFIDTEKIEGVCVINEEIYNFPDMEHIKTFIKNYYPIKIELSEKKIYKCIQGIIHRIGKENEEINLKENVIFKLFQNSMCCKTAFDTDINSLEIAYLKNNKADFLNILEKDFEI